MASEQAQALKAQMIEMRAQRAAMPAPTLEEMRANSGMMSQMTGEPEGVTFSPVDAGGCRPSGPFRPRAPTTGPSSTVHGGGYVLGSPETVPALTGHLANAIGCRVLNVDYRLAPENPHPGPVKDSVTAYRWLLDQGYRPEHLAIAGDSAGGGLTLATLLKLRADGLPQPAAAVPLSPWTDMEGLGELDADQRRSRRVAARLIS